MLTTHSWTFHQQPDERHTGLKVFVLGPHATRDKLPDYIVPLGGLSVASCAAVNYLGVIINSSLSFETHIDNIIRIAFIVSQKCCLD